jgi:SAM-dependent methyltransferase
MPTTPSQPTPLPGREPHQAREMAESFGVDAERYDRSRPRYPGAMVERITAAAPGRDVLDVGCGTGIAARQFRAAGCTVLGVDPDARMAEPARRSGIEVEVAAFESWEPAGREFDAVVAGQSWHWVDPAAGAAQAARVLRPGGRLAVFWNLYYMPPEVGEAVAAAVRRVLPDAPFDARAITGQAEEQYRAVLGRIADGIRAAGGFGEPEQWRFPWEWTYTRDAWLDQLPTFGLLTRLPKDRLDKVLADVGPAVDALGGAFTMAYTTVVLTAARSA